MLRKMIWKEEDQIPLIQTYTTALREESIIGMEAIRLFKNGLGADVQDLTENGILSSVFLKTQYRIL